MGDRVGISRDLSGGTHAVVAFGGKLELVGDRNYSCERVVGEGDGNLSCELPRGRRLVAWAVMYSEEEVAGFMGRPAPGP
jgi:hypothetical protein